MAKYALVTPTPFKVNNIRNKCYYVHSFKNIEIYNECQKEAAKRCLGFWRLPSRDMNSYQRALTSSIRLCYESSNQYAKWIDDMLAMETDEEWINTFIKMNKNYKRDNKCLK